MSARTARARAAAFAAIAAVTVTADAGERPLTEAVIDLDRLSAIDAVFSVRMGATLSGAGATGTMSSEASFQLATEVESSNGQRRVVMEDEFVYGGRTMRHESLCEARGTLRPEKGAVSFSKGDRVIQSTYVVDGDDQVILAGGRQHERELPFGAVTQQALMRIVCQLPRETGEAWTFDAYAETFDQGVRRPVEGQLFRVVCMGFDEVDRGEGPEPAWRFDFDTGKHWSAWVSDDGDLLRVEADGGSTVLTRVDTDDAFAAAEEPEQD